MHGKVVRKTGYYFKTQVLSQAHRLIKVIASFPAHSYLCLEWVLCSLSQTIPEVAIVCRHYTLCQDSVGVRIEYY